AEDGIRDPLVTGVQTCALPISPVDVGARESKGWIVLKNCRLISNPANDGDSFHASARAREYIFRLYMVDAPETDEMNPARLVERSEERRVGKECRSRERTQKEI